MKTLLDDREYGIRPYFQEFSRETQAPCVMHNIQKGSFVFKNIQNSTTNSVPTIIADSQICTSTRKCVSRKKINIFLKPINTLYYLKFKIIIL